MMSQPFRLSHLGIFSPGEGELSNFFLMEPNSTPRDLSKNDFFKILAIFFGLHQFFWVHFLTNLHFWEICSDQSKDLLNSCLFRGFSEFKKILTGLNKSVYKFVDFSCPQLYIYQRKWRSSGGNWKPRWQ